MKKIILFKLVEDKLELCGYFDTEEQIKEYLEEIKKLIDDKMQHELQGDYVALPSLLYTIRRK